MDGKISLRGFEQFLQQEQSNSCMRDYSPFFRDFNKSGGRGSPYMTTQEVIYVYVLAVN